MGSLFDTADGRHHTLGARHVVGRSRRCDLRLSDASVSGEHATLLWKDGTWCVRDLGSRNGTFVRGVRVEPGEPRPLAEGDAIAFGAVDTWVVESSDAPVPRAVPLDGGPAVHAREGVLALPSDDDPELVVREGDDGRWRTDARRYEDQETVSVSGRTWRLLLPQESPDTAEIRAVGVNLRTARLRFRVSANEEVVELDVIGEGDTVRLPERAYWYTLLVLGRERLSDASTAASERGWVDRALLLKMLGIGRKHLNVQLHRARRALGDAGVLDVDVLVERRGQEVRLGVERVEVAPL